MSDIVKLMLAFFVAFLMAFLSTPLAERVAYRIGAIDVPKDSRRMHKKPIPRLGGLAIFFGFVVGMVMFAVMTREMISIMAGALLIVALGVLDDRKPIRAIVKLLVQIVASLIVIYFGGVKIDAITNPNIFSPNVYLELGWLSVVVTVIWICGVTNAVNLIDGLDGLAAGVSAIIATSDDNVPNNVEEGAKNCPQLKNKILEVTHNEKDIKSRSRTPHGYGSCSYSMYSC